VTCEVVLELARRNGLATSIRPIAEGALREAEEIWITSSTKEVLAVTELDGRLVGKGEPGPLCRQMQDWYQKYKNTVMRHGAE